jgi:hypothetical protein
MILGLDCCLRFGIYKLKKLQKSIERIEEQNCAFEAPKESINFIHSIVKIGTSSNTCIDSYVLMEWLHAMMSKLYYNPMLHKHIQIKQAFAL